MLGVLVLTLFVGNAFSDIPDDAVLLGKMTFDCVVQDQVILRINDGKPKRYTGFTDDLKIGDRHSITINWFDFKEVFPNEKNKLGVTFSGISNREETIWLNKKVSFVKDGFENLRKRTFRGEEHKLDVWLYHTEYEWDFYVSDSVIYQDGYFSMKRYYKDDWDFLYSNDGHSLASNCVDADADISKFIEDLESLFE